MSTPPKGIPDSGSTVYGMTTANPSGQFGCDVYGSVFHSAYLQKYVIICTAYESFTNMYVSNTPFGPWSKEYGVLAMVAWHTPSTRPMANSPFTLATVLMGYSTCSKLRLTFILALHGMVSTSKSRWREILEAFAELEA